MKHFRKLSNFTKPKNFKSYNIRMSSTKLTVQVYIVHIYMIIKYIQVHLVTSCQ